MAERDPYADLPDNDTAVADDNPYEGLPDVEVKPSMFTRAGNAVTEAVPQIANRAIKGLKTIGPLAPLVHAVDEATGATQALDELQQRQDRRKGIDAGTYAQGDVRAGALGQAAQRRATEESGGDQIFGRRGIKIPSQAPGAGTVLGEAKLAAENQITSMLAASKDFEGILKNADARAAGAALDAFSLIEQGANEDELRQRFKDAGIGATARISQYARANPQRREELRQDAIDELFKNEKLRALALDKKRQYIAEVKKNTGDAPNFTEIETAKDFQLWLARGIGGGAVSIVPAMITAYVTRNPAATAAVMYPQNLSGEISARSEYAEERNDPTRFPRAADRSAEALAARDANVAGYGEQNLGTSLATAAGQTLLDVAIGPEATALKEGGKQTIKQMGKTALKDVVGEGGTGGAQQVLSIAGTRAAGEQEGDVFSAENIRDVINSAADEAAGGVGGASMNAVRQGITNYRASGIDDGTQRPPGAAPAATIADLERIETDDGPAFRTPSGAIVSESQWNDAPPDRREMWMQPAEGEQAPTVPRETEAPDEATRVKAQIQADIYLLEQEASRLEVESDAMRRAGQDTHSQTLRLRATSLREQAAKIKAANGVSEQSPTAAGIKVDEEIAGAPAPLEPTERMQELERLADVTQDPAVKKDLLQRLKAERQAQEQARRNEATADAYERAALETEDKDLAAELKKKAAALRKPEKPSTRGIQVKELTAEEAEGKVAVRPGFVPDSAFNGDVAHSIETVFMSDAHDGSPIELTGRGMTAVEIAALEEAGLATDGRMSREQWRAYDKERSARLSKPAPKKKQAGIAVEEKPADRRKDDARRKKVDEMSAEELRKELKTSPVTGLPNRRAYDEAPKRAVTTSIDVDSLKWVNDNMGHPAGDEMLRKVGEAIKEAGADGFHLSGDEFVIQSDTPEQAEKAMRQIRKILAKATVSHTLPDGSVITKKGIDLSHGSGRSVNEAESKLRQSKAERARRGVRPERGAEPKGVDRKAPGAGQAAGSPGVGAVGRVPEGTERGNAPAEVNTTPLWQKRSGLTLADAPAAAKIRTALAADQAAVMRAAERHPDDEAAFLQAIQDIIDASNDNVLGNDDKPLPMDQKIALRRAIREARNEATQEKPSADAGGRRADDVAAAGAEVRGREAGERQPDRQEAGPPGQETARDVQQDGQPGEPGADLASRSRREQSGAKRDQAAGDLASRSRREEMSWEDVELGERGDVFVAGDFMLDPVRELEVGTGFGGELMLGHAANVAPGNRVVRYHIAGRDGKALGRVDLQLDPQGNVVALHDISVQNQGQGVGRQVVGSLLANFDNLQILDIVPTARAFWEKLGVGAIDVYGNATLDWTSFARATARQPGRVSPEGRRGSAQRAPIQGSPQARQARQEDLASLWYSPLQRAIQALPAKASKASPQAWQNTMRALGSKGVKADEIAWSGVMDWLATRQGPVTRDEVLEFLRENGVQVTETVLGSNIKEMDKARRDYIFNQYEKEQLDRLARDEVSERDMDANLRAFSRALDAADTEQGLIDAMVNEAGYTGSGAREVLSEADEHVLGMADSPRYTQYTLPGGKNNREILITLPAKLDDARNRELVKALGEPKITNDIDEINKATGEGYDADTPPEVTFYLYTVPALDGTTVYLTRDANGRFFVPTPGGGQSFGSLDRAAAYLARWASEEFDVDLAPLKLEWQQETDNMLKAQLPSGNMITIVGDLDHPFERFDSDATEMQVLTPTGEEVGDPLYFGSVEEAKSAAARMVANRNQQFANVFRTPHWEQSNVVAHVRVNERTDADGKRVLFVEEIQSDWAQKGRKLGFGPQTGIPVAPFVQKTEAWTALALKRVIRYAAENGFDRVAWITGEQSADRYDLSKQVESITWNSNGANGTKIVKILATDGQKMDLQVKDGKVASALQGRARQFEGNTLDDVVGKEIAEKIESLDSGRLSGEGLKVGGKGMRKFYDEIVPNVANDVLKKLGGGKVLPVEVNIPQGKGGRTPAGPVMWEIRMNGRWYNGYSSESVAREELAELLAAGRKAELVDVRNDAAQPYLGLDITPRMRELAMQGMPLFSRAPAARRMPRMGMGEQLASVRAALDDAFGKPLIDALIKAGILRLEYSWQNKRSMARDPSVRAMNSEGDERGPGASLFLDRIRAADAPALLMHEVGEHYGLPRMLGQDGYQKIIDGIRRAKMKGDAETVAAWGQVKFNYTDPDTGKMLYEEGSDNFIREVAAAMVEKGVERSWIREMLDAIRSWLARTFGVDVDKVDGNLLRGLATSALRQSAAGMLPRTSMFAADRAGSASRSMSIEAERISPRAPTGVNRTEDPLTQDLQPDLQTMMRDPAVFEHNLALLTGLDDIRVDPNATPAQQAEQVVAHFTSNILALHDAMRADDRERSKEWYVGGNRIAHRLGQRFGVPPRQVAAVIAALSPQRDWFTNVSLAERFLSAVYEHPDDPWTPAMLDAINRPDPKGNPGWGQKISRAERSRIIGKTLREVWGTGSAEELLSAAHWIRAWDEATNPNMYRVITPEGDFMSQWDMSGKGPMPIRAGSFVFYVKALKLMANDSRENISNIIGADHKVRSFYNNIIAPHSRTGDVTIDTHAMAAAHWLPLGSSDDVVRQGFGGGNPGRPASKSSIVSGISGNYAFYAEAYRRAAAARGILPREMQSITWEAVRGLFRPEQKKSLKDSAATIWARYGRGEIDENQARQETLQVAGRIARPKWAEPAAGDSQTTEASTYAAQLPQAGAPRGSAAPDSIGDDGRGAGGTEDLAAKSRAVPQAPTNNSNLDEDRPDADRGTVQAQPGAEGNAQQGLERWFGADSNLRNPDGSPMRLYHGAEHGIRIDTFKPSKTGAMGPGVYLGDSPEVAAGYSGDVGQMIPVYARGRYLSNMEWSKFVGEHGWAGAQKAAEAQGFAGVYDRMFESAVAVWDPANIRSAFSQDLASRTPNTSEFMRWFGNSKVVDADGNPLMVYHGTTGDFDTFNRGRANPESDFGAGFYFSNTPDDVANNYAGEGPDLTAKLEMEMERIERDIDDGEFETDVDIAKLARDRLGVQHGGASMPVYLKMENPLVVGNGRGGNDTFLDYDDGWNPETEEYDAEPTASPLQDFIEALRDVAGNYHDGEVEGAISTILEEAAGGGIRASKLIQILKDSNEFSYYTDDDGRLVRSEIWRQAFERAGFDGIIDNTVDVKFGSQTRVGRPMRGMDPDTVHYIVFKPTQIKSAIGNRGTYDPNDPSILAAKSRALPQPPSNSSQLDAETNFQTLQRKFFDRFNRVRQLQRERRPGIIDDKNVVQADTLYYGRAQYEGEELERKFIEPLGEALKEAKTLGLTVRDADDYLMAKHAPERNRVIAQRNPNMPDGGSGLTNRQAAQILAKYDPKKTAALDKIAQIVYRMNEDRLLRQETSGLMSPQMAAALRAQFKYYVPLKTLDEEDAAMGVGRGYEVYKSGIEMAFGRQSKAGSPIAASIMDAARAVVMSEKAKVSKVLWNLANDPDVIDVMTPVDDANAAQHFSRQRLNPTTGQIETVADSNWRSREDVVHILVDGEDKYIWVRDDILRDQLRKVATLSDPGPVLRSLGKVTSTIGRLLTEFNPAFTLPNAVRDAIGGIIKSNGIERVSPARVAAGIPVAWKAIVDFKRDANTPGARMYRDFQQDGAKTGAYGITDVADTMHRLERLGAELGYPGKERGITTKLMHGLNDLAKFVGHANEVVEYATRLALYTEARRVGYSRKQAAVWAKELTVNFNRSGEYGRTMNSIFVFANAALQGLYGAIMFGKSNKVKAALLGLVVLGAITQAFNEAYGGDDEDTGEKNVNTLSDHTLDNNATVLIPGSASGIKIPLPPEFSFLYAIGRRAYRAMSQGNYAKEAAGIVGATLGSTLPLRAPDASSTPLSVMKALTPTAISPFMDIAVNEDFRGAPIVPNQREKDAPQPWPVLARSQTSDVSKAIASLVNTATGGDTVEPGAAQKALGPFVSPEAMDHVVGFYTGGLGQFALQSKNLARAVAGDEKAVEINRIPIANRFVFTQPIGYVGRRYRELASDFQYAMARQRDGSTDKVKDEVLAALPVYRGAERQLGPLFKQLRAAGEEGDKVREEELRAQIRSVQSTVLKAYNEARPR